MAVSLQFTGTPLVGLVDTNAGVESGVSTHPSIHRISKPLQDLFCGLTQEQLITEQKADPDIAPEFGWIEKGASQPPRADKAACIPATRALRSQYCNILLHRGEKHYTPGFLCSFNL